jgi:hypothetical protein
MTAVRRHLTQASVIIGIIVGCVTVAVHLGILPWVTANEMALHTENQDDHLRQLRLTIKRLQRDHDDLTRRVQSLEARR